MQYSKVPTLASTPHGVYDPSLPAQSTFQLTFMHRLAVRDLVDRVSTATYKQFSTKHAAEECFLRALCRGKVHALDFRVSYVV